MIKDFFTAVCVVVSVGLSDRAAAQNDSCNASCSFTYHSLLSGQTAFTGQSSGVTNPLYTWYVNGAVSGNGPSFTGMAAEGDDICLETVGYSFYYDSLQQYTDVDTCYAIHCETYEAPHMLGCDLDASYTYTTNVNGQTTFTGSYSGTGMPSYGWTVNGNYVGNGQSTYTGTIPAGAEVCFHVNTWSYGYDSLQVWYSDTCSASFCEVFGGPDSVVCDLQTWFTQSTNENGVTTFVANHADSHQSNMLYYFWSVNGNEVWEGTTYSADLPAGTEVCLQAVAYGYSMQQLPDTCYASYCNVVSGPDSMTCDLQTWFTQSTNENGVTTFVADHSDSNGSYSILYYFWSINGTEVWQEETYSASLPAGTEVCLQAVAYGYLDSIYFLDLDTCYASYCDVVGGQDSLECNLTAGYTSFTDSLGYTVFTGNYSGTSEPVFFWIVDGIYMGGGQPNYSGLFQDGTEVCFEVREYNYGYDSLTQQWYNDTCFAYHCEVIGQTASIGNRELADFTLYPNPASTSVSVLISANVAAAGVEMLDVNGRLVLESGELSQIDVSALQQGVYYVKIVDTNGDQLTGIKKFVRE